MNLIHEMNIEDLDAVEDGYSVNITARKSKQVVDLTNAGKAVAQVLPIFVNAFVHQEFNHCFGRRRNPFIFPISSLTRRCAAGCNPLERRW